MDLSDDLEQARNDQVIRLRHENKRLRHLLGYFLPPHSGYCGTVECNCGPLRQEADRLMQHPE